MENASKALIMAGSILMSMMIIGMVVFMFNTLSSAEQTKTDADEATKITEYSQRFEQYNKVIYGSELLSLANLQEDYNKKQAEEKGYKEITITVTIKRSISGTTYFSAGNKSIDSITNDKNIVEDLIRQYENNKTYNNRTVKYYTQISNREIAQIYGMTYSSNYSDYEVGDILKYNSKTKKLMAEIDNYKNIKSIYTEFKNKRFKCDNIVYGQTGRVNLMKFTEI